MMWLYYTCTIILLMIQYLNKTIVSGSKHTTIQLVSTIFVFVALNYNVIIIDDADFLYKLLSQSGCKAVNAIKMSRQSTCQGSQPVKIVKLLSFSQAV